MREFLKLHTRRQFFGRTAAGIGTTALASLLNEQLFAEDGQPGTLPKLHFAPKAKRVIYLVMSGGPSHLDLLDHKPKLKSHFGEDLPASIRMGQRITGMTSGQRTLPVAPSMFKFNQHGKSGTWISELLPNIGSIADDIAVVNSLNTEAINHDPAITFVQTGSQQPGRPSLGGWLSYGIGSMNKNLPAFVVMISQGSGNKTDQPIFSRLWGSGFLPSQHQGVRFRSGKDPVLYLSNPDGVAADSRRDMLDAVGELNKMAKENFGDPEINTRIEQYEMAFRMQTSVPELADLSGESAATYALYGEEARTRGTFASSALMARRLVERGVRFVQIFHRGWDQHGSLPRDLASQCKDVDQACYGLVQDLKQRGLLEDTLVIWGGEFGRTVYSQGTLTETNYGRDHHPRCFTIWMAGGGVKAGSVYGETDEMSYNIVKDPVHVRDLHATILHLMGIDHERLSFKAQGLDQRLTGVVPASVVKGLLA